MSQTKRACLRLGHLVKNGTSLFCFIFFQIRSTATLLQKAKNPTKNCSFSDTVWVGLPEKKDDF